jgi:serine/threonine protein phosphatase PrpC
VTTVTAAAGSDIGHRYAANFDVAHLDVAPLLAVVADGMGDSEGSALAGRAAVDGFVERIRAAHGTAGPTELRAAVAAVQDRVLELGKGDVGLAGCTLTALLDGAAGMWIVQLGDSRVYRQRGLLLELLTVDHTMAWLGVAHGIYPFDSPDAKAGRYQLNRYVGHARRPAPDVLSVVPEPGDVYLLCSDGIADQVPYLKLREILQARLEPETAVQRLLAEAEAAGGEDNATAVVVALT